MLPQKFKQHRERKHAEDFSIIIDCSDAGLGVEIMRRPVLTLLAAIRRAPRMAGGALTRSGIEAAAVDIAVHHVDDANALAGENPAIASNTMEESFTSGIATTQTLKRLTCNRLMRSASVTTGLVSTNAIYTFTYGNSRLSDC